MGRITDSLNGNNNISINGQQPVTPQNLNTYDFSIHSNTQDNQSYNYNQNSIGRITSGTYKPIVQQQTIPVQQPISTRGQLFQAITNTLSRFFASQNTQQPIPQQSINNGIGMSLPPQTRQEQFQNVATAISPFKQGQGFGKVLKETTKYGLAGTEALGRAAVLPITIPILLNKNKSFKEKLDYFTAPFKAEEGTITKLAEPGLETVAQVFSANRYQPDLKKYENVFANQITEMVGTIGGNIATFGMIQAPLVNATKSIPSVLNFAKQFPRSYRALSQGLVWATHGQIMADQNTKVADRAIQFAKDFTTGGLTGVVGEATSGIKGVKGYTAGISSSFVIGAGLAKLDGASDKDAAINGFIWAGLHASNRAFGEYKSPTQQKENALQTFNQLGEPFGVKLNENSSADDISNAYKKLIKTYHPDVLGTGDTLQATTLNAAKDMLLTKGNQLANPNDETFGQEIKRLFEYVKQGGTKKLPEGTLENINTSVGNAIMKSPKNSEITKALEYSPNDKSILSQKFIDNMIDDLKPQVNAYIKDPKLKSQIVASIEPLRKGEYTNIKQLVDAVNEVLPMNTDMNTRSLIIGQPFLKATGLTDPDTATMMADQIFTSKTTPTISTAQPTSTGQPISGMKPFTTPTTESATGMAPEASKMTQEATLGEKGTVEPQTQQPQQIEQTVKNLTERKQVLENLKTGTVADQDIQTAIDSVQKQIDTIQPAQPIQTAQAVETTQQTESIQPTEQTTAITSQLQETTQPITLEQPTKVTKAASDINKLLVEKGMKAIPETEMAKYSPGSYKEDAKYITNLLDTSPEKAIAMATGIEPIEGIKYPQILFNSVEAKAEKENDYETLSALTQSPFATKLSESGATLGSHGYNDNELSPIAIAQRVIKARSKSTDVQANKQTYNEEVKKIVKRPTQKVAKEIANDKISMSHLEEFIRSIRPC